ncbi:CsbD family protein [Lutimonas halocynthiae]|uniref:CsbD family protein n=1 Tax=Lutimonas halocynthiae TaxID=1446477 RepID=UPI0025B2DCC7|nr:CsbD family protein [Lutimonas halocynthiae]MDN3641152.1 CsbD family protein [Lutimonas halocynthiae]
MNNEQLDGKLTQIKGDAKIWVGELTNNQKMQLDGATDKIKGGIQEKNGDIKAQIQGELKKFEAAKAVFETRTEEVNTDIKNKWNKLTHDDVQSINGSFESFSNLIKEKYNKTKNEADQDVREFMSKFK